MRTLPPHLSASGTAAAAAADAEAAARKSGADRIFERPKAEKPAGGEVVKMAPPPPKRPALQPADAAAAAAAAEPAAPPPKRAKQPNWPRRELMRLERLMLAFGHRRAAEAAETTTAQPDAEARGATGMKRALDLLVVVWLVLLLW